jgi:tetratricopeptide (TPR) repeat protein
MPQFGEIGRARARFHEKNERFSVAQPLLFDGPFASRKPLRRSGYAAIVDFGSMLKKLVVGAGILVAAFAQTAWADARSDAKAQVEFGIAVATRGLWKEATYRWQRATEIDPQYAEAYNNLAIAYEHEGQLDKARKAYEKAIELDPNNTMIRQNFDLFKEINDRPNSEDTR